MNISEPLQRYRVSLYFLAFLLVGCASTASKMLTPMVQERVPYWDLQLVERNATENIVSISRVPADRGARNSDGKTLDELEKIEAGNEGSWTWTVYGKSEVARTLAALGDSGNQPTEAQRSALPFDRFATDVDSAMSNMYAFTRSLLPEDQLQVAFDIYLLREDEDIDYRLSVAIEEQRWRIPFVIPFRTGSPESSSDRVDLFSDLTRVGAVAGSLAHSASVIQRAATESGEYSDTDKLTSKKHQMCWHTVGRRLLYVGHPLAIRPPVDVSSITLSVLEEMWAQNPEDLAILATYAVMKFQRDLNSYIEDTESEWPRRGTDIEPLESMFAFCTRRVGQK